MHGAPASVAGGSDLLLSAGEGEVAGDGDALIDCGVYDGESDLIGDVEPVHVDRLQEWIATTVAPQQPQTLINRDLPLRIERQARPLRRVRTRPSDSRIGPAPWYRMVPRPGGRARGGRESRPHKRASDEPLPRLDRGTRFAHRRIPTEDVGVPQKTPGQPRACGMQRSRTRASSDTRIAIVEHR